jgi:hypothetical protein
MGGMDPVIGSLAVAVMIAFIAGGVFTYRKGDKLKGVLMVVFAVVILGNMLVFSIPVQQQQPVANQVR